MARVKKVGRKKGLGKGSAAAPAVSLERAMAPAAIDVAAARPKKVGRRKGLGKGPAAPPVSLELTVAPMAIDAAAIDASSLASAPRIVLDDVLDQTAAGALVAELLSHRGVDAVIDATAVRRIGGQCLQVLLSAAATWTRDGAALALVNSSPEFITGVRLLGIDPGELGSRKPFAGAA